MDIYIRLYKNLLSMGMKAEKAQILLKKSYSLNKKQMKKIVNAIK